ncbi:DUF4145 domain-containing protein [Duganella sp. FT134W]|uniref:DUF4145 domain-containing protein n=3 Tax=Telluria group TaxID=2895353 RepID=A0A7X4KF88_9BURK|nr:DUF4145 domain-containing protein [Duganella margarita]MYN30331.1 DUF4145 domain-containing protein [Duganella levis]
MLSQNLELPRCPHCAVANPNLAKLHWVETTNHAGQFKRFWYMYSCRRCGGVVTGAGPAHQGPATEIYPSTREVDIQIPERPRAYLQQAHDSLHAPAGAVMLAASAVDSMLKAKNYPDGSLYNRIERAVADHVLTEDMGKWAHAVRLDANDQRHADDAADLPSEADARRVLDFARTLAEVLFVLPSRVERGLQNEPQNGG